MANKICCTKTILLLLSLLLMSGGLPAQAGGRGRPVAVFVNDNHPDLPLKFFAAGKLGIIRSDWAKSYLTVAYRYLNGNALDAKEQESILALWHKRIAGMTSTAGMEDSQDIATSYFVLRAKETESKLAKDPSRYDFEYHYDVLDDAFAKARQNLQEMIKRYGSKSAAVKDWLSAQDAVFGTNSDRTAKVPPPLKTDSDRFATLQRQYQIAAAKFYTRDLDRARSDFEELAKNWEWKDLAQYLSARCVIGKALAGDSKSDWNQARMYVQNLIDTNPASRYRSDLLNLAKSMSYLLDPADDSLKTLCSNIVRGHSTRFGEDVGDLSSLMDGTGIQASQTDDDSSKKETAAQKLNFEKFDLSDWLNTMQTPALQYLSEEEQVTAKAQQQRQAKHALERWRQHHNLPWLIAAVSTNNLSEKGNDDLLAAAQKVTVDSPAYFTVRFYLIDELLRTNPPAEARRQILSLLARKDLPPSARNLFSCQMQMDSSSVNEYLNSMVLSPLAVCALVDDIQFPDKWKAYEQSPAYHLEAGTISNLHADDLNANLPQSYWMSWAKNSTVPKALHANIARAAWVRAAILGKDNSALDSDLIAAYPQMKKWLAQYRTASAGAAKRYALSCLFLKHTGMSPYIESVDHHEGIDTFNYYQGNYWTPLADTEKARLAARSGDSDFHNAIEFWKTPLSGIGFDKVSKVVTRYDVPVLRKLLSTSEKSQLDAERKQISLNDPAHMFPASILEWARLHPEDPSLPEMLYRVVKLPLWAPKTELGSKYSRQALAVLHKRYPRSSFAKKVKYAY